MFWTPQSRILHYTMYEPLARFQYLTGLKPVGPHTSFALGLLRPLWVKCSKCKGRGMVGKRRENFKPCVHCEGTGMFWNADPLTVDEAIKTVRQRFAGCEATPLPKPVRNPAYFDPALKEVVPIPPPPPKDFTGFPPQSRIFYLNTHYGMYESRARFQYLTGLEPVGPHMNFAMDLLRPLWLECSSCNGRGMVGKRLGDIKPCVHCEGTGMFWNADPLTVDRAIKTVRQRFAVCKATPLSTPMRNPACFDLAPKEVVAIPPIPPRVVVTPRSPRRRGIPQDSVVRAFRQAERLLGIDWKLKGRGHCPRVSLARPYSAAARRGAWRSWNTVCPHGSVSRRHLMARAIVEKAAELLEVPVERLMIREY